MLRRLGLIFLLLTLLLPAFTAPFVSAQSSPQALTHYALAVYSGPDRSTPIIGVLNPQARFSSKRVILIRCGSLTFHRW